MKNSSDHQAFTVSQEAEALFWHLFETASDSILILETQTTEIIGANPALQEFLGCRSSELCGKKFWEAAPFREVEDCEAIFRDRQRKGFVENGDLQLRTKTGRDFRCEFLPGTYRVKGREIIQCRLREDAPRQGADQALLRTEKYYRALIEQAMDIFVVINADGTSRFLSRSVERVLGWKPAELVGRNAFELLYPDDRERIQNLFYHSLTTFDKIHPGVFRIQHKDGSWRVIEFVASNLLNDPDIRGIIVNSRDITDRKRYEQELQRERTFLRTVIDAVPSLVFVKEPAGCFHLVNEATASFHGSSVEKMVGTTEEDYGFLHSAEQMPRMQQEDREVTRSRRGICSEGQVIGADGQNHWFATNKVPLVNEDGSCDKLLLVATDITERKQAEKALRESEQRFHTAFVHAAIGKALVAPDGRFLKVNRMLCRLTGYSEDELLAKKVQEFSLPEELPAEMELNEKLISGKICMCEREKCYVRKSGEIVWGQVNVSVVRDRQQKPLYFIKEIQDITERKRLEKQILEVADREQARIGQDLHDSLCQYLSGIKFRTSLIAQKLGDAALPQARDASEIETLLGQALEQARNIAHGLLPVTLGSQGLVPALEELAVSVSALYNVSCDFQSNVPVFECAVANSIHLYRIAQEAVSNAVKHGRATRVWIELAIEGNRARLTIRDNGEGLPSDYLTGKGMGIHIMRHRAGILGASFNVGKARPIGTNVTCSFRRQPPGYEKQDSS